MNFSSSASARYAAVPVFILMLLISSGVALGQERNAGQSNPEYSAAPGTVKPRPIDNVTLKRSAKAYVQVKRIVLSARRQIDFAKSDQQKEQIAAQAESDKIDAVKAEGLEPRQYNQVMQLAEADKTVRQKLLSYVNELEGSPQKVD